MNNNSLPHIKKIGFKWLYIEILMALSYVSIVFYKQYRMLHAFWFPDFDMSIVHQGIWLLSRFQKPFVTIRGMHLFSDHTSFIDLIFVPIYWIYDSPLVLLFGETLAIGIAGFLLYLISAKQLNSGLAGIIISFFFFSYPALHYVNFFNYHPVVFAIPSVFLLWYGYLNNNKRLVYLSSIILVLTRESMPLLLIGLGIYLYFLKKWKPAKWLPVIGIISLLLLFYVAIPYFNNGIGFIYMGKGPGSLLEVVKGNQKLFDFLNRIVITKENKEYLIDLFLPIGFIPIFNPLAIITNPLFAGHLIADWPYVHTIKYHYPAEIIGTIFISLIESLSLLRRGIKKVSERYEKKYLKIQEISLIQNNLDDLSLNAQKKFDVNDIDSMSLPQELKIYCKTILDRIELLTQQILQIDRYLKTLAKDNLLKKTDLNMDTVNKRIRNFKFIIYTLPFIIIAITTIYSNKSIDHPMLQFGNILKKEPQIDYQLVDELLEIKSIVKDDSISATYQLLPFFASRKEIFLWKNPFKNEYYGPTYTETYEKKPIYILLHKDVIKPEDLKLVEENNYKLIKEYNKLLFFKTLPD